MMCQLTDDSILTGIILKPRCFFFEEKAILRRQDTCAVQDILYEWGRGKETESGNVL